jgi:hypothetical protein
MQGTIVGDQMSGQLHDACGVGGSGGGGCGGGGVGAGWASIWRHVQVSGRVCTVIEAGVCGCAYVQRVVGFVGCECGARVCVCVCVRARGDIAAGAR